MEHIDYETRHKLSDLLDLLQEEVSCKTYNGWVRRRQPDDIRKEINGIIERLTRSTPPQEGFDGSTVRVGPNHSTIEIWYDTEAQARAAHRAILASMES